MQPDLELISLEEFQAELRGVESPEYIFQLHWNRLSRILTSVENIHRKMQEKYQATKLVGSTFQMIEELYSLMQQQQFFIRIVQYKLTQDANDIAQSLQSYPQDRVLSLAQQRVICLSNIAKNILEYLDKWIDLHDWPDKAIFARQLTEHFSMLGPIFNDLSKEVTWLNKQQQEAVQAQIRLSAEYQALLSASAQEPGSVDLQFRTAQCKYLLECVSGRLSSFNHLLDIYSAPLVVDEEIQQSYPSPSPSR